MAAEANPEAAIQPTEEAVMSEEVIKKVNIVDSFKDHGCSIITNFRKAFFFFGKCPCFAWFEDDACQTL